MMKMLFLKRAPLALVALFTLTSALPGLVSARSVWHQGRNVNPKVRACSIEKEAEHHALLAWDNCMGGQIKPPNNTNAAAYYWLRRRKCKPKYNIFTNARRKYQACVAQHKSRR